MKTLVNYKILGSFAENSGMVSRLGWPIKLQGK